MSLSVGDSKHAPRIKKLVYLVTYRCNCRCTYCLSFRNYWQAQSCVTEKLEAGLPELTLREVRDLLLPQVRALNLESIVISGGEPLLREDAVDLFALIARSGVEWSLDSNLMLCGESTAASIVGNGCREVTCSINGPCDVHNALRRCDDAFSRAIRGLRRIIHARRGGDMPQLTINCTIQHANESVLSEVVEIAVDVGADRVTYQALSDHSSYLGQLNAEIASKELERARFRCERAGIEMSVFPLTEVSPSALEEWYRYPPGVVSYFTGCEYVSRATRLDPYGNVMPCVETTMGSIKKDTLDEIWLGTEYVAFRERVHREWPLKACLRCCNLTRSK